MASIARSPLTEVTASAGSGLPEIVGHETLREHLAGAFAAAHLPSSLLLYGPEGAGKQRLALWVAQMLVCRNAGGGDRPGPCDDCVACSQVRRLEHPDVHWFFPVPRPKGASGPEKLKAALEDARKREMRDRASHPLRPSWHPELRALYLAAIRTVRELSAKRPATGARQVFVIGEAELLVPQESSPEAANALLKVLEEPPEGTTFILTASRPEQLLPTIRSRAVSVHVPPLPTETVVQFLLDEAGASPPDANRAATLAEGSIGKALAYLPNDSELGPLESVRREAWRVLEAASTGGPEAPYQAALAQSAAGARTLGPLFDHLGLWVRDLAAVGVGADAQVVNVDALDALRARANGSVAPDQFAEAGDRIEHARILALSNVNPQLVLFGLISELRPLLTGSTVS